MADSYFSDLSMVAADTTVQYIKDFFKYGKNSSYASTFQNTIKFLRWWCNCSSQKFSQEQPFVKSLTNGIIELQEEKLLNEALDVAKQAIENVSENVHLAFNESNTTVGNRSASHGFMFLGFKIGIILLFLLCFLYIIRKFKHSRKIPTTVLRITSKDYNSQVNGSHLQITKGQEFQSAATGLNSKKSAHKVATPTQIFNLDEATEPKPPVISDRQTSLKKSPNNLITQKKKPGSSHTNTHRDLTSSPVTAMDTDETQKTTSPGSTD